ncbi:MULTISPECIES: hypothetical protein [Lysinibacillus]|uniref:hypothetical protein n=1 Tax=Lysinibacillus TaxID=400634 RepID=UPI0036E0043F
MEKLESHLFHIKSNLLNMAFFGGHLCNGYINNDDYAKSRAVLTYLTKEIFSIHRFPGFDEYYLSTNGYHLRKAFMELTLEDIQEAKDELEKLYIHTQTYLKEKFPSKNSVILGRSLNYEEVKQVTNRLLDKNVKDDDHIQFETNIILSFADKNFLGSYGSNVFLKMDVSFDQILMHYDCIYYPDGTTGEEKEHEVWVINNNLFGRITQPKGNFKSENLRKSDSHYLTEYDFPLDFQPKNSNFYSYDYAFERHFNVWNDPWVQSVIKLRRKLGKIK